MNMRRRKFLRKVGTVCAGAIASNELIGEYTLHELSTRSSWRLLFYPEEFIEEGATDDIYHMETFTRHFEWSSDPLNGLYDTVSPVDETIEKCQGDCTDYAAVALNYVILETDKDATIHLLSYDSDSTLHFVVHDGEHTYSVNGYYDDTTVEEYCKIEGFSQIGCETLCKSTVRNRK